MAFMFLLMCLDWCTETCYDDQVFWTICYWYGDSLFVAMNACVFVWIVCVCACAEVNGSWWNVYVAYTSHLLSTSRSKNMSQSVDWTKYLFMTSKFIHTQICNMIFDMLPYWTHHTTLPSIWSDTAIYTGVCESGVSFYVCVRLCRYSSCFWCIIPACQKACKNVPQQRRKALHQRHAGDRTFHPWCPSWLRWLHWQRPHGWEQQIGMRPDEGHEGGASQRQAQTQQPDPQRRRQRQGPARPCGRRTLWNKSAKELLRLTAEEESTQRFMRQNNTDIS